MSEQTKTVTMITSELGTHYTHRGPAPVVTRSIEDFVDAAIFNGPQYTDHGGIEFQQQRLKRAVCRLVQILYDRGVLEQADVFSVADIPDYLHDRHKFEKQEEE